MSHYFHFYAVCPREPSIQNLAFQIISCQVVSQRLFSRHVCVVLGSWFTRRRPGNCLPMIKDFRDVKYFISVGFFNETQNKVVVLRSLIAFPEFADFINDLFSDILPGGKYTFAREIDGAESPG